MRKLLLTTAIAAAAIAAVVGSAPALAGTGGNGSPSSSVPGHFSYTDFAGPVKCNEVHHPSNKLPGSVPAGSTTTGGYDTVNCVVANPPAPLVGQTFVSGWSSDFGRHFDQNTGLIQITVAADGTSYGGVAWYPNG
jgi:hypothetical protein